MKYLSTFEVAEKWGISTAVSVSSAMKTASPAHRGRVDDGLSPENAEKPADARVKSGKYIKSKTKD